MNALLHMVLAIQTGWSELTDRSRKDRGATAVEYGLMVALIAIVIIAAVVILGTNLSSLFGSAGSSI